MDPLLYIVDRPIRTEYAEAAPVDIAEYDYDRTEKCPQCGELVSGAYWLPPREVVLSKRKIPDFLYHYNSGPEFVISERALIKIQETGLTGITSAARIEKVRFQRKAKLSPALPDYYCIELKRSRITIDHAKSSISYGQSLERRVCPLCRQVPATYDFFRSIVFNMNDYEGFDIFQCYELGDTVILSQRFVDVYRESGLNNLHFEPAKKYGREIADYFEIDTSNTL